MLELNLEGLNCPLPVLHTKKFLAKLNSGEQIKITTTDFDAKNDLEQFCLKTGNKLISQNKADLILTTIIERR